MPHTITIEILMPWLEEKGATTGQLDAVEGDLMNYGIATVFEDGVATLIHRTIFNRALEAIDAFPWDPANRASFSGVLVIGTSPNPYRIARSSGEEPAHFER